MIMPSDMYTSYID